MNELETARRDYLWALGMNPNLAWSEYLDGAAWSPLSPMQRGPQWASYQWGPIPTGGPMYGADGYASTAELYRALMAPAPKDDRVPMSAAIEAMQRAMREREEMLRSLQDQLAEASAERDQLAALLAGPEWSAMEAEGAEHGPWAALATARATLVDAYKLREHALQACQNADAKIVELEADRAKYNREYAELAKARSTVEAAKDKAATAYARTVQERSVLEAEHARLKGWVRAQRGMTAASVVLVLVWLGLIAWQTSEHWWPLI